MKGACRGILGRRNGSICSFGLFFSRARFEILLSSLTRTFLQLYQKQQMADEDTFLFTSESVNEGHPDKLADQVREDIDRIGERWREKRERKNIVRGNRSFAQQRKNDRDAHLPCSFSTTLLSQLPTHSITQVSDAILDACLEQDPDAKVRKKEERAEERERGANEKAREEEAKQRENATSTRIFPPFFLNLLLSLFLLPLPSFPTSLLRPLRSPARPPPRPT